MTLAWDHPDIDAVICFNDLVALGMLSGFLAVARKVGREIRVGGFDDIEECAMAYPPLSSARCNIAVFGRRTAATLLSWLEVDFRPPPERGSSETRLAVLNSKQLVHLT